MYKELAVFRKSHGLEYECGCVVANMYKELGELVVEIESSNTLKMVDEFCDLVIYPVNAIESMGHDAKSNIERIMETWKMNPKSSACIISAKISAYYKSKDTRDLASIAAWSMSAIRGLGFEPELCVLEKAKCINSRNGAYDADQQKWCKDESQDKSTLYKPNYESCKIKVAV